MIAATRNLGDLTKIRTGKLDANASSEDGQYPFFTCARQPLRINSYTYDCECVLVAGNGDLNVKYYDGKFDAYQRTYIVESRPESKDNLYLRYVYYFLETYLDTLREQSIGGIIKYIKLGNLTEAKIPLPPLAEQKRIAAILDAADVLRAKRLVSLEQTDALLQSTFLDMFGDPVTNPKGWTTTTLPEISTRFTDGPFGSNLKSSHYVDAGVRVIRLQNIGVGEMLDDDLAFISWDHYKSLPRNHCKPGDVVIGTLGEPNLRACLIPDDLEHALNKADCLLCRADLNKAQPLYVCWLLNCPATVSKALELVRGQTRGRISMGRLKELQLPLPPLELQQRFASFVSSVEQQKARLRKHLAELDTLFASLQQRAFSGEL